MNQVIKPETFFGACPHDCPDTCAMLFKVKDGKLQVNMEDEITRGTIVTQGGEIVNPRLREFFSLPALETAGKEAR